jgi:hypothetical protein
VIVRSTDQNIQYQMNLLDLYIKLLGREPETGAVQGNPIHAGRNTADVIRDFLKSEEYAVQRSTHFYRRLLQRESSEPSGHA